MGSFTAPPAQTFVMHGEPGASRALADEIANRLGWQVQLPERGETYVPLIL